MNEFIEKLITILDEEFECYPMVEISERIRQLAEEYKGGWIPCSERLPSYDGPFICTAKGIEESLELIYSSWDNSWMDEFDSVYEVFAWQPLPEPYRQKEGAE